VAKKKPAKSRAKGGRPSLYKDEFATQAHRLCLLGATDVQVAEFFGVSISTVDKWKQSKPVFLQAIKDGKEQADAQVAHSLYRRALGYSHKAVKILTVPRGGNQGSDIEEVPYIERYPPDTTAAIFWLKNRRPDEWRDRQQHELTGKDGGPIEHRGSITWGTTEIPL